MNQKENELGLHAGRSRRGLFSGGWKKAATKQSLEACQFRCEIASFRYFAYFAALGRPRLSFTSLFSNQRQSVAKTANAATTTTMLAANSAASTFISYLLSFIARYHYKNEPLKQP